MKVCGNSVKLALKENQNKKRKRKDKRKTEKLPIDTAL